MTETIVSAAILVRWEEAATPHQCIVSMPRPGRHGDVLHRVPTALASTQGFLTSTGRFVNRREGWKIAEAAGQFCEDAPTGTPGTLYSEDLW